MSKMWRFVKQNKDILESIASIVAILLFAATVIGFLFKSPALTIKVSQGTYVYPKKFYEELLLSSSSLQAISGRRYSLHSLNENIDSLCVTWGSIISFISQTKEFWVFEITNNTNRSIKDIDIRIPSMREFLDLSVEGTALSSLQEESLYSHVGYDENTGLIVIANIEQLPPKSSITLKIWGRQARVLGEPSIYVYSDNGTGKLIEPIEVEGARGFVARNLEQLLLLLILTIFVIFTTRKTYTKKVAG